MSTAITVVNLVLLLVMAGCLVHDRRRYRSMMRLLELSLCSADRSADQVLVHQLRARISAEQHS